MYIDTQEALDETIADLRHADFITIDTEFLHEKTYYPQLCLIQLATRTQEAIIDPFAPLDLKALVELLTDEEIMKVFHAGEQDRIILFQMLGTPVHPVFDLQRAVLLLGFSHQVSLMAIVRHYCNVNLKKGESYSDWAQRPLTEEQLNYAIDDVRYLPTVYQKVTQELRDCGRLSWLNEDFKALEDESCYLINDREVWRRLKGAATLKGQQISIAREICSWRELTARKKDLPKKWVLSDDLVLEICRRSPDTPEGLYKIRSFKTSFNKAWIQEILDLIAKAKQEPQEDWPAHKKLPGGDAGLPEKLNLLTALLHLRSRELQIASTFLTNHEELLHLASGQREGLNVLKGWRFDLVGKELVQLLDGEFALSLCGDDLKVTLLSQADASSAE